MPFIELDSLNRKFYLKKMGDSGPAIICVHGFGHSSSIWLPFILPHIRKYRFLLIDLPGFGRSKLCPSQGDVFLEDYSLCIKRTLEYIGGPASLVGFSLGAFSSLKFLTHEAHHSVEKYLHIDHTPFTQHDEHWRGGLHPRILSACGEIVELTEKISGQSKVDLKNLKPEILKKYFSVLRDLGEISLTGKIKKAISNLTHDLPFLKQLSLNRAAWPWAYLCLKHYYLGTYDLRPHLDKVKIPTTLLFGQKSELFNRESFDFIENHIPGSQSYEFKKSGHDLMFSQPLLFHKIFKEFLEKAPGTIQ